MSSRSFCPFRYAGLFDNLTKGNFRLLMKLVKCLKKVQMILLVGANAICAKKTVAFKCDQSFLEALIKKHCSNWSGAEKSRLLYGADEDCKFELILSFTTIKI